MPVQSMWVPRTSKRRLERWVKDPVTGAVRLSEVLAAPGSDQSDVENQGATVSLLDEDAARTLDLFGQSDPTATASIRNLVQTLIDSDSLEGQTSAPGGQTGRQPSEQRGLAMSPEKIRSVVDLYNIALDSSAADAQIDQQERKLVQTMQQRGYSPQQIQDFFQAAQQQAAPPAPGGQTGVGRAAASGLEQSPAYDAAYGYQDATALKAARQNRIEALQRVADTFEAHDEGAKWLETYGDAARALTEAEAAQNTEEAFARSNPRRDKDIVWTPDNQTTHNPGAASAIRQGRQALDRMLQMRDPAAYAANKAAEEERRRQERIAQGFGGYDDAQEYDPVTGKMREKKKLPGFAGGGMFEGSLFSSSTPLGGGSPAPGGGLTTNLGGSGGGTGGEGQAGWAEAGPGSLAQQGAERQSAQSRLEAADRVDQQEFDRAMAEMQTDIRDRRAAIDRAGQQAATEFQGKVERARVEFARRASVLQQERDVRTRELALGGLRQSAPPTIAG